MQYTAEQMQKARAADIYSFILYHFPDRVKREGRSIRLNANHSLCQYLGYSLVDAVLALSGADVESVSNEPQERKENSFLLPERSKNEYRIKKYLGEQRDLDSALVDWLIKQDLLFEDLPFHNCCFLNHDKDFCEFRGTVGSFHKVQKKKSDNFWYFYSPHSKVKPIKCFICESAIDCILLFELKGEDAFYCSLAGVGNYGTIERLRKTPLELILAVDSDSAGQKCREKFYDLPFILPENKDWNEDLKQKNNL